MFARLSVYTRLFATVVLFIGAWAGINTQVSLSPFPFPLSSFSLCQGLKKCSRSRRLHVTVLGVNRCPILPLPFFR